VRLSRLGLAATLLGSLVITGAAQSPAQPDGPRPAQAGGPRKISKPSVVRSGKHDVSPALRDIPPKAPKPGREPHPPQPLRRGRRVLAQPDPVLQSSAPATAAPSPIFSFEGVNNGDGVLPPDTNGDIGPNHYVQWVNLTFAVYSRSGSLLYGPAAGGTIWDGFGGPCESQNDGDPIVLYDELADRWIMSQFAIPNRIFSFLFAPFYQCIAVSQTPDPTGPYHRYQYEFSKLNDYPKFGVWPDGYYMAINQFAAVSLQFAGQGVIAFDRAAMLAGQPADMIYFDLADDLSLGGMLPSDLDGQAPPAGSPNYFAQVDDDGMGYPADQMQLWQFHADWASPTSSTFTGPFVLPVAAFDSNMCDFARGCIPQPGTTAKIDALSDRLMYRLQYRNFGTHDALVVNHTVDTDGADHAGVRWYEIRNPGTAPVIHQQGTFAPDSLHRWMGSAAMDAAGNIALAFNVSGTTMAPSIRYAARLASDPPGVLGQGESDLITGTGSQTHAASRWGDYSMLGVDPVDGCTFWATGEYYAVTTSAGWQTRIGAFRLPGCGPSVPPPDAPENLTASTLSSTSISLAWTDKSADEGGFQVERCIGSMATCAASNLFTPAGLSPADGTTFVDNGLQASTTYSYRVRAFNGGGTSAYSNLAQATTAAPPTVTLAVAVATATEAGTASGTFIITRGGEPTAALVVTYTLTGTATKGTDYLTVPTTATIPAGAASVAVTITPIDDSLVEVNETVVLTLKASAGYVVGTPSVGTVTIVSDDVAPDLVVSALTAPATSGAGSTIQITDTTKNQGTGTAGASTTSFYLSVNGAIDAADTLLGTRDVPELLPGATNVVTTPLTLPSPLTTGTYSVIAKADGPGVHAETSETNNTRSASVRVGPDLTITVLTAPASAAAGATISVTDTTANPGGGSAPESSTRFYLSLNTTVDATDTPLQARVVPALAAGATHSTATVLTIPASTATGTYYVVGRADDGSVVLETAEINNTRSALVRVGADLTISALTAPAAAGAGKTISVSDTTANPGGGPAPESSTRFYLSLNNAVDAADTPLQARAVPALAAGATHSATTVLTIPVGTEGGTYYVVGRADDGSAVSETVETNNTRGAMVRLGPNLTVSGVSAPARAAIGSTIAVTDTTSNAGAGDAPPSATAFYLSANHLIDAAAIRLSQRSVGALPAGAASTATTNVVVSNVAAGTWWLMVNADDGDEIAEPFENNYRSVTVLVGPDLIVSTLSTPATATAGSTITVTDTAKNQGAGDAAATVTRYYLSANSVFDSTDILLAGERTVPVLAGGVSLVGSTGVTLPAGTTGNYYVIAVTDAGKVVGEVSETNNTAARLVTINP
jgi:subtilase family serine protease